MLPEFVIQDVETFNTGYKIALQQELAETTPNLDLNVVEIDAATAVRVLENYALSIPERQQWLTQVWRDFLAEQYENSEGINLIQQIENLVNTFRNSPIINQEDYLSIEESLVENDTINNLSIARDMVEPVIVNGKPMDISQIELLINCYCEITGYHFKRDQDYNVLTDVVRAIDFIAKGGRLEFEADGITQEQLGFNLVSNPPSLEFLENNENKFQINDIAQAKAFVEEPSQATVIANIIQELSEEKDPEIKAAGATLNFIFNYKSSVNPRPYLQPSENQIDRNKV